MDAQRKQINTRPSYISGSTAYKLSAVPKPNREEEYIRERVPVRGPERLPKVSPQRKPHRKPQVTRGIGFFSMVILLLAMTATLYVSFQYLHLQSDLNILDKKMVLLNEELKDLTDHNNAAEIALNQPVDLNQVYEVAVGELGMVFPNHNQVIEYESQMAGYVRQYSDIPSTPSDYLLDKILP